MEPIGKTERAGPIVVRRIGVAFVGIGVLGTVIGAFLPWVYSGAAARNSFEVVRTARRLGIVDSDALRLLMALWYFVPFLAAVVVLLLTLGRSLAAGAIALVLGAIVLVIGLVVEASSADLGAGPAVASAAGACAVLGGLLIVGTAGQVGPGGER